MAYRRVGRSGVKLPAISLGLWHNFGDDTPIQQQRAIMRRAFDLGITHFDLANNYGPPYGSAEINAGRILEEDFAATGRAPHLDQGRLGHVARPLRRPRVTRSTCSTPWTGRCRLRLDHVDIFYHHRFDPDTPLEERPGGARRRGPPGQGPLRGHLVVLRGGRKTAGHASSESWGRRC